MNKEARLKSVLGQATLLPFFPVATHKFVVLSVCTLGLYELYWCYQNWKRLADASGEAISPFWRGFFFAPVFGFSLFRRIHDHALAAGIRPRWSPGALATAYLVLMVSLNLPDPWWLITIGSVLPMIPVQQSAQRINDRYASPTAENRNRDYNVLNVVGIMLGGTLLVLGVIATFWPA